MKRSTVSERALVLAPRGRDAAVATAMLAEAGIEADACASLPELIQRLNEGAAFVVVTEEAITTSNLAPLSSWLADQEEWSDLPFVLLTTRGGGLERNPAAARHLGLLGNVTFLERPFHPTTLISLAHSALRGRRRQYDARARLLALRSSEHRFRTLFDTMDEGFCVIRFLDGEHGPLSDYVHVQVNAAYERHAGIANAVGQRVRDMVPDEADGWVALYREVLLTGEAIRFERKLIATGRFLELSAFRVEGSDQPEVAVIFQDTTARKRAELELRELNETLERRVSEAVAEREAAAAQLVEAQKLETLGQLTGGVAHDVNNLLTPITGALDLLHRKYAREDPRAARWIDGALQSAERARLLVSRLLGFARRQALETRPVDVAGLLDGMRDLIASSIGSGIELKILSAAKLKSAVADPNQLELALLNLCVNARDAMPGGGEIRISAHEVIVGSDEHIGLSAGAYVRLSVVDTGTGMDKATLARAIEPFYSTKELGKGTGLGLSMVHGLAAQLGGAFILSSTVGKGTRADLYLPASAENAPMAARYMEDVSVSRFLKILLVDDEQLVRDGTAEMLRDMGHEVVAVDGAKNALATLEEGGHFDAILTDYMMPSMNGAQFAAELSRLDIGLPVLVVTGYAGGDLEISLPQLAKPFRRSDLAIALERLVGNKTNVVAIRQRQ
ncbi:hybrid sensor histidine kinase/response regulator [Sphingomonas mucosissima]|uniref:histidine kinase n=1 Tax=Sphingomonas mucosissima TaxID=370959 RepID=A0A245ZSY0_9SPHN|nr:ATP-binding protein [Sphingomonas mucosissima]OWK32858.1 blue-light-activated protein [Sphingomonas mucosissima]